MSQTKDTLLNNLTTANVWVDPVPFKRLNAIPIEYYSLFGSKAEAAAYAYGISNNTSVAYVGQIISVLKDTVEAGNVTGCGVDLYVIVNPMTTHVDPSTADDYLMPLASVGATELGGNTYTKVEIDGMLEELPKYMVFRGTLGENGTITELPTASIDTNGDVYKVITNGTYAGISAKFGDTIVCSQSGSGDSATYSWVLIPSGDEDAIDTDTWREIWINGALLLGSSTDTPHVDLCNGAKITVEGGEDGKITVSHDTVAAPTASANTSTQYVTGFTTDGYGHITGFTYNTESNGFSAVTVITPEGDIKVESQIPTDVVNYEAGNAGIVLGATVKGRVPVGTPYYEGPDLTNELGHTDIEVEELTVDETYSKIEIEGEAYYIHPIQNKITISHKEKVGGSTLTKTAGTGRTYVTDIVIDEFGHIQSIAVATETDQSVGVGSITTEDGNEIGGDLKLSGDGKWIETVGDSTDNTIQISHKTPSDSDPNVSVSQSGETPQVVTGMKIDEKGHIYGKPAQTELTLSSDVETDDDKISINLGTQKSSIREVSTDLLRNGSKVLILDGNFD